MIEEKKNQLRYYGLLGTMLVLLLASLGAAMGIMHIRHTAGLSGYGYGANVGQTRQISVDGHVRSLAVLAIPVKHKATAADAMLESKIILNGFITEAGPPPWSVQTRETYAGHTFFINRDLWTNWQAPSFVLMAATSQGHDVSMIIYHGHLPIQAGDNALFQKLTYKLATGGQSTAK